MLIYLRPDSSIAENVRRAVKRNTGLDNWGVTSGHTTLVYKHNKWIIWHEALHLLGVDECYDVKTRIRKPDCNCETCIMQYEPSEKWVGEWSLCDKNIEVLQNLAEKVEQVRRDKKNS
jgi:hypothetical protein